MAAERYLSGRIPDLRVGNDIDRIDKKQIQVILWSMTTGKGLTNTIIFHQTYYSTYKLLSQMLECCY